MIRIAISAEAFEAITATFAALPKGSVGFELEPQSGAGSRRLIRLHEIWLDKVRAMRRKRESYSDVILRSARGMNADENTPIVANAARLLRDAKLLNEHGRHASAFALATLSLEEIGKVILRLWCVPEPKGGKYDHLTKQRTVASSLLGQLAVREFADEVDGGSGEDDEQFVACVVKAMSESGPGLFKAYVEMAAVDKAIYYDDRWVAAGLDQNFERKDAEELFEKCRSAIRVVADTKMMRVGKAIFEVQIKRPPKDKGRRAGPPDRPP